MKKIIQVLFAAIVLSACGSNDKESEGSSGKDLSTDEAVLAEVNRISKHQLSKEDVCIDRPKMFKDLILVGYFAHDRGCDGGMMFYEGKEVNPDTDYPKILRDNGWDDRAKREVLALEWVKKVSLAWTNPMEYIDDDFKSQEVHTFMPPTVKTEEGEITVTIWVREPSGMNPDANFYLQTVVFSVEEADIIRSQITDRFTVEFY